MAITTKEYIAALIGAWQTLHDKMEANDASTVKEDLHIHLPSTAEPVGGPGQAPEQEALPPEEEGPEQGLDADPNADPALDEVPVEEEPPVAEVYPVVGEERRIRVYGLAPSYLDSVPIGEAWQDENGELHGTGLCRTMLFEPFANRMYTSSAAGLDTSPLAVFAFRLSMSPFVRIEWEDPDAE